MSKANGEVCKSLTTSTTISCPSEESPKMVSSCKINGCDNDQLSNGNAATASSKLSKIGRRIRDSCRQHLRGKHPSGGASSHPEDYGSIPAPNVSDFLFTFLFIITNLMEKNRKIRAPSN